MFPETIAIVMAPNSKTNDNGIYRLTPKGLRVISSCTATNMFHSHNNEQGLYEKVGTEKVEITDGQITVSDLRTNVPNGEGKPTNGSEPATAIVENPDGHLTDDLVLKSELIQDDAVTEIGSKNFGPAAGRNNNETSAGGEAITTDSEPAKENPKRKKYIKKQHDNFPCIMC
jgi:hypothetical protein